MGSGVLTTHFYRYYYAALHLVSLGIFYLYFARKMFNLVIFSSTARCRKTETEAILGKEPELFLRHFMERARNAAICALVQAPLGSNLPPPMPMVMPLSTAQATACA